MLVSDKIKIGNKLYKIRMQNHLKQSEVAERAGIAEKTYANIERGNRGMQVATLCRICSALDITPDFILVEESEKKQKMTIDILTEELEKCSLRERRSALELLSVYLKALKKQR